MSRKKNPPSCAECTIDELNRICMTNKGVGYKGCPTLTKKDLSDEVVQCHREDKNLKEFARISLIQDGEGYSNCHDGATSLAPIKSRVLEIIEFCQKMHYKKLGLAFCIGLRREAAILSEVLKNHGFDVISTICKTGGIPKETLGVLDDQKIYPGEEETICNPVLQAKALEAEGTDFNLVLGLCVGHDSMFFQFSHVPVTVVAVKDRVTGHNPLAVLYNIDSYYNHIKNP